MAAHAPPIDSSTPSEANPFRYVVTAGTAGLLTSLGCTLAATTYQAGKLVLFRADGQRISALFRTFDSAMGLAVAPDRLAIGSRHAVWVLRNAPEVGRQLDPPGKHDACFIPRSSSITGDIRIHELAWCESDDSHDRAQLASDKPQVWFVNTRFSCLCTLHPDYSFVPRWWPPFVSALEPEDRCHLNGMAVRNGRPVYVTALGMNDTKEGWRAEKAHGGVVIDIASGQRVTGGLAMPHSPRVYRDQLFVLNSGQATLEAVDRHSGKREVIARFSGYPRGLAFIGEYAFVGLSRIREKHEFGGLPIERLAQPLTCGIACVEIESGRIVERIEFETGCEEIFDVQILQAMRYPAVVGLQKETIDGVFIVPPDATVSQRNASARASDQLASTPEQRQAMPRSLSRPSK